MSDPADRFAAEESEALRLDASDALSGLRDRFLRPPGRDGIESVYFAGNSLGLQPRGVAELIRSELDAWAERAVDAHFGQEAGWYAYHRLVRDPLARLVGALPEEVVAMNGLTVNLHLMLVSFYRPTAERRKILIEDCAFPSDTYAVKSQLRFHGCDPDRDCVVARPRRGEATLRTEDIEALLDEHGGEIALVLLPGVNYFTGQVFDMARITECAQRHGCIVGFDLAHAAGNIPLALHDWNVDFAVWCSYKYLNAGPGAVAGCFVHERHGRDGSLPRFAGWWGNDPDRRFLMHLLPDFEPVPGAEGWQISNPPILALAPLRASLALFDEAGIEALRRKSVALTAYLQGWIEHATDRRIEILTPDEPAARGCQVSLRALGRPRQLADALHRAGVVGDFREPDVVRIAPVPLYNSFHDIWRFGRVLAAWSEGESPPRA